MRYYGTVIRPPSEARSYILQVTYGCSHNRCTFCGTYLDKPFKVRETSQVMEDIELAGSLHPNTRRVFLADGDALVLSANRLNHILDALRDAFPHLERVGTYANAQNLLRKSIDELKTLRDKGLGIVYLGLESGDDGVLERIEKGATAAEMISAASKAKQAGLLVSVIGILGIAGPKGSPQHARLNRSGGQPDGPGLFFHVDPDAGPGHATAPEVGSRSISAAGSGANAYRTASSHRKSGRPNQLYLSHQPRLQLSRFAGYASRGENSPVGSPGCCHRPGSRCFSSRSLARIVVKHIRSGVQA